MNREELYDGFAAVDDEILERSERERQRRHPWGKWAAAAACLCLMGAAAALLWPASADRPAPWPDGDSAILYQRTSDTYENLDQLLAWLSEHDSHGGKEADAQGSAGFSGQGGSEGLTEKSSAVVTADGRYTYHIGEDEVWISRLDGESIKNAGSIAGGADGLFVWGDTLLTVAQFPSGGEGIEEELSVRVRLYDITAPEAPVLREEYVQLGALTACWMAGGDLYLVTGDGQCACGWSRLEDTGDYRPQLTRNGEAMAWGDEDISILGSPARAQYAAVTVISPATGAVRERQALYGDIQTLFYGADYLAVTVAAVTDTAAENPVVYTFGPDLDFTGKINPARILDIPDQNPAAEGQPQAGEYLEIDGLTMADGVCRMVGTCTARTGEESGTSPVAIAADLAAGTAEAERLPAEDYPAAALTEILWEEERAILCVRVTRQGEGELTRGIRFLFVQFTGGAVDFLENSLEGDYLDSRVGASYGNPLGSLETLIPLGDGLYLRYACPAEGPCGFATYDFTHSAAPEGLYAGGRLSGEDAFDYLWYVYDSRTVGTLKVLLGEEDYFRDVGLAWCVYAVDPEAEEPLTLLEEYPLGREVSTFFGADALGAAVFPAGDQLYYADRGMDAPVLLG